MTFTDFPAPQAVPLAAALAWRASLRLRLAQGETPRDVRLRVVAANGGQVALEEAN